MEGREIIVNTQDEEGIMEYKIWLRVGEGPEEQEVLKNRVGNVKKNTNKGKRWCNKECKEARKDMIESLRMYKEGEMEQEFMRKKKSTKRQ